MVKQSVSLLTILCALTVVFWVIATLSEGATTSKPRIKKTIIRKRKPGVSLSQPAIVTETSTIVIEDPTLAIDTQTTSSTAQMVLPLGNTEASNDGEYILNLNTNVQPELHSHHRIIERNSSSVNKSTVLTCDAQCNPTNCIRPQDCLYEIVLDHCSCCYVCAAQEGDVCFNSSLNNNFYSGMGLCGSSFNCLAQNDLNESTEATCQCRDTRMICGSDNITYTSECKLREAALLNSNLTVQSWYPCITAPWIEEIENATVAIGDEISLSCEVKAFPSPVIHWEFLEESSSTIHTLPGDDSSIVVTIRGGPEQMMTSSWIQIISVSPRRQGIYFCFASNTAGTSRKQTYVSVYNKSNDNDNINL